MKTLLTVLALSLPPASAFADHTRFVPPRAPTPVPASPRESNPFFPYSRSQPRVQRPAAAPQAWHHEAPSRTDRPLPYSRSLPRFNRHNA